MTSASYPDPIVVTVNPATQGPVVVNEISIPGPYTVNAITVGGVNQPAIAYHYVKNTPSLSWVIAHNLNFYPNVTVVDSGGTTVEGDISYTDTNNLTITFTSAFSGNAYLS